MASKPAPDALRAISPLCDLRSDFVSAHSYGSGHISDTFCAWFDHAGQRIRSIVQRINHNVFKQPAKLMENIERGLRQDS